MKKSRRVWKLTNIRHLSCGGEHILPPEMRETYLNFDFQFCVHLRLSPVPCKSGVVKVLQASTIQVGLLDPELHSDIRTPF